MQRNRMIRTAVLVTITLAITGGLSGEEADRDNPNPIVTGDQGLADITLLDGFAGTVFAEPSLLNQPIAIAFDDRGRLWVAETLAYQNNGRSRFTEGRDRIVILEDQDGDGVHDKRTIFHEKLNRISAIAIGFGGVWVGATPYLQFIPDRDGDDKPDSEPETVLDGWDYLTHHFINSFIWGPDGWLYGLKGIGRSEVGIPGTPGKERLMIQNGVWRYHPTKRKVESWCRGSYNPWGIDYDDHGELFQVTCITEHLYHAVQGGRLDNRDWCLGPYIYDYMKCIADHSHRKMAGGHSHCGLTVYLGDAFPEQYRNRLFMGNVNGRRVNVDIPVAKGSGYSAGHGDDLLITKDNFFLPVQLKYGADGAIYVCDFYEKRICWGEKEDHLYDGRILKIHHKSTQPKPVQVNIGKLSDDELVALQLHRNDWFVRRARLQLQARGPNPKVHQALLEILRTHEELPRRLRALWALHATQGLTEDIILESLQSPHAHVRAWTVQLACEDQKPAQSILERFTTLAKDDPSPVVRRYLASALPRLPEQDQWRLLNGLTLHTEDNSDPNIPMLLWYGLEPLIAKDAAPAIALLPNMGLSQLRRFSARRITALNNESILDQLITALGQVDNDTLRLDIAGGIVDQLLTSRARPKLPASWPETRKHMLASPTNSLHALAEDLSLIFGDPAGVDPLRKLILDVNRKDGQRADALNKFAQLGLPDLLMVLQQLFKQPGLVDNGSLLQQSFEVFSQNRFKETAATILEIYPALKLDQKRKALYVLVSRLDHAQAVAGAINDARVAPGDLTQDLVRRAYALKVSDLDQSLLRHWGVARQTPRDKRELIGKLKSQLQEALKSSQVNRSNGRLLFDNLCLTCHRLHDAGGSLGPDLTGSNRFDLDYLLENIVDPNAAVDKSYILQTIHTFDERVLSGVIQNSDKDSLSLKTVTGPIQLSRNEIAEMKNTKMSAMPEGLLQGLKPDQIRDLVAYLQSKEQVPTGK